MFFLFLMTHEMSLKKKNNLATFLRFWSPPTHASSADPSRPRVVLYGVDCGRFMVGLWQVYRMFHGWKIHGLY